jgi:predicted glycosyltransferase
LPPRVDMLKLPAAPVSVDPRWATTAFVQPAQLSIAPEQVLTLRAELSLTAVRVIGPDVVVVDHAPLGWGADLRPTLDWLRSRGLSTVALGLRDFDNSDELRSSWNEELVRTVCSLYDLALVYNDREIDDSRIQALLAAGLPIHRTGLLGAPAAHTGPPDLGEGYLLVTCGGGIDGFALLDAVIDAVRVNRLRIPTVLVTGPMMPSAQVARLRERAPEVGARVERERADMESVLAGARAVVSMAGYCTVAEILASGVPALLVPRSSPCGEQLNRARHWAAAGHMEMLDPGELEPIRLGRAIAELLEREPVAGEPLTGAAEAGSILEGAVRQSCPSRSGCGIGATAEPEPASQA